MPKISALTAATSVGPTDTLAIVQGGETKRATAAMVGIYARTAAEIAASVTPTDYRYEPGDVRRYGTNTVPGTTDLAQAIRDCLAGNGSCRLPAGRIGIGSAITLSTGQRVEGAGAGLTFVETLANTHDAFTIGTGDNSGGVSTTDARRVYLGKMTILSQDGIGASNAAIRLDDATSGSRGVVDSVFEQLYIGGAGAGFKYGIYGDDLCWNNTFETLWFEDNERSVRLVGASNINNLWSRCYFHESNATVQHVFMQAAKHNVFENCLFGGRKVQLVSDTNDAIAFDNTCVSMKFVGCNFENYKFATDGLAIISVGDGSSVDVDSCTFVEIDADSGKTAYYLRSNDNSLITVRNCVTQLEGSTGTLYHLGVEGLGKIEVYDYVPVSTTVPTSHGLTTVADIGGTGHVRFHNVPAQQLISPEYDLDATGTVKDLLLDTTYAIQIGRVHLRYSETTSADAGIALAVQADTNSDNTADSTISSVTTEINKSAGTRTEGTLTTEKLAAGQNAIWVSGTLNKTGAGKCRVIVDFWYRGGN